MAIRNNLLGGNDIQENEVEFRSTDFNDTHNELVRHDVNNYRTNALNLIRQLEDRTVSFDVLGGEWGESYINDTGRLDSVDTTETNAVFDDNKYKTIDGTLDFFVIIEGDVNEDDYRKNGCDIREIETGKWVVYSMVGNIEEQISRVYMTVIPNGSNLTSIKTSEADDVGKRMYYGFVDAYNEDNNSSGSKTMNITFDSTTDNENVRVWALGHTTTFDASTATRTTAKIDGTTIFDENASSNNAGRETHDYRYVDMSAYIKNNPSTAEIEGTAGSTSAGGWCDGQASIWILTNSPISYSVSDTNPYEKNHSFSDYQSNGVPDTESSTDTINLDFNTIVHDIPSGTFPSNLSSIFGYPKIVDWEDGCDVEFRIINNYDDSGWLNIDKVEYFDDFTSEPTKCLVKLKERDSSPTEGYPSISGFCLYGDKQ